MTTSQRTEDGTSVTAAAGVPGTASNLPRPSSRPGTGSGGTNRRTENISYQSSRMVKHLKLPQGSVKRISVSVLLDQTVRFDKGKRVIEPPSPEKLKVVKDLVVGIAGVVPERGDQIIVESFPFESTLSLEQQNSGPAAPLLPAPSAGQWLQQLMQKNVAVVAGVAGGILLLLAGFVVFKMKRKKVSATVTAGLGAAGSDRRAIGGRLDSQKALETELAEEAAAKEQQDREVLKSLKLPAITTKKTEVLVKHIGMETKKDPAVMAQVIRSWLNNMDN
jgi:flagellar M-ring protein FliF